MSALQKPREKPAKQKSVLKTDVQAKLDSRLRARSMWIAVLGIGALYIGSTVLTPLYAIYERRFHFSDLVVTEIYAVYVLGNLTVLFLFGRLSDQIGRRRTTLIALCFTAISAALFLLAASVAWLFVARALNGFSAGLGAGALTAWIAELEPNQDRTRATEFASAGNLAGLAFGALAAGLLAVLAPWPLRTSWVVYIAVLVVLSMTMWSAPETVEDPIGSFAELSLKPRIGVPSDLRWAFVAPCALAFASFALGGFYAALTPSLLMKGIGQTSVAVVGAVVALFFGAASMTAVVTHHLKSFSSLLLSVALLLTGLGLLLLAEGQQSLSLLIAATLICGAAMGLGYRGSLQTVNEMAPGDRRAELLSTFLLVCYTANSLPIVGVGLLSQAVSAKAAHRIFALLLALLGVVAVAVGLRRDMSRERDR
jgi:MFS family permease